MSWEVASFSSREISSFKIFTKRQLILLAILLPVLYCYFFHSEWISQLWEEWNVFQFTFAHSPFFNFCCDIRSSVVIKELRHSLCCPQSSWENWLLLQKLSGFRLQLRGCLCCWSSPTLGNTLLDFFLSIINQDCALIESECSLMESISVIQEWLESSVISMVFFVFSFFHFRKKWRRFMKSQENRYIFFLINEHSWCHSKPVALPGVNLDIPAGQILNKFVCYTVEADCQQLAMHCHFCIKKMGVAHVTGDLVPE